jgi:hypothetical protein
MLVAIYGNCTIYKLLFEMTNHTIESFIHCTSQTGQEKKAFVIFGKQERHGCITAGSIVPQGWVCHPQKFWVAVAVL